MAAHRNGTASKGAPRALVVDDDEAHLRICSRTLVEQGYEVETATGAESALRAVRAASFFDVIVSDIHMPGMSGVDFVAQLRTKRLRTSRGRSD